MALLGSIIPKEGVEDDYDQVQSTIHSIEQALDDHLREQKDRLRYVHHQIKPWLDSLTWCYRCHQIKYKDMNKEIYQLEIPAAIKVPQDFIMMSKTKVPAAADWSPLLSILIHV